MGLEEFALTGRKYKHCAGQSLALLVHTRNTLTGK